MSDEINPQHYKRIKGIECIDVVENFDFCLGNAIKYIWRAGHKTGTDKLTDLKKAQWYIERSIMSEEKMQKKEAKKLVHFNWNTELIKAGKVPCCGTDQGAITTDKFAEVTCKTCQDSLLGVATKWMNRR